MFCFSSRRRHTRCAISDWSSDVCSSDLHRHSTQCSYDQIHVHALSPPDERTTPNQVCSSNVYGERVNERKVRLLRAASCSTLGPNRLHLRPPFLPPARHRVADRTSTRLNSSH